MPESIGQMVEQGSNGSAEDQAGVQMPAGAEAEVEAEAEGKAQAQVQKEPQPQPRPRPPWEMEVGVPCLAA